MADGLDDVAPCGECLALDLRAAMCGLVDELQEAGCEDPLLETFTLAAVLDDLARRMGVEPPASVVHLVGVGRVAA